MSLIFDGIGLFDRIHSHGDIIKLDGGDVLLLSCCGDILELDVGGNTVGGNSSNGSDTSSS